MQLQNWCAIARNDERAARFAIVLALPRLHRTHGLLLAGLIASGALYTYGLDRVPAFLTLDEAHFSVHAASIAQTGRNLNGQWLPTLISLEDPEGEPIHVPWGTTYYLPFGMYLIAAALKMAPISEAVVRMPSALLGGVVNVALIYAVALACFRSRIAAAASAAVLALAPANVIISRQALDSVCQVPFVLGALWCIATYRQRPQPRLAMLCGAILGAGIYAYITSIVLMPFYLLLFWAISWRAGVLEWKTIGWSIAGFAIALLPMTLWLALHPEAARSLAMQYNRADPGSMTLMQSLASGGLGGAIASTAHIYWSYFDPGFLFVQGGNARNLSTGEIGVFLLPVAALSLVGLRAISKDRLILALMIIGLLVSPLPAVVKGAPYAIQRASGLLIYVSLLSGAGFAMLCASRHVAIKAAAILLAVFVAWQFSGFYSSYFTRYRVVSGRSYDSTAFRGAADLIIANAREAAVYLPVNYYDVGAKWRFYTMKAQRRDLWLRTRYYADSSMLASATAGAIALLPDAPAIPPGWTAVGRVEDLGGETTAVVVRKQ